MSQVIRFWRFDYGERKIAINSNHEAVITITPPKPDKIKLSLALFPKKQKKACVLPPFPPLQPRPEKVALNIARRGAQIWKPKYRGISLLVHRHSHDGVIHLTAGCSEFKRIHFSTACTVKDLIEYMPKRLGQGWAITEVHEAGGGCWTKGTTVVYGTPKARATLADMGWTSIRGAAEGRPPVFLVVHKSAI